MNDKHTNNDDKVTIFVPEEGCCVKAKEHNTFSNVYINLLISDKVLEACLAPGPGVEEKGYGPPLITAHSHHDHEHHHNQKGKKQAEEQHWQIPFVLAPGPRHVTSHTGKQVRVFDIVFGPKTYAMSKIFKAYGIRLDKEFKEVTKYKMKGRINPQPNRNLITEVPLTNSSDVMVKQPDANQDKTQESAEVRTFANPDYTISRRHDYLWGDCLVVIIYLPYLATSDDVDLRVSSNFLQLSSPIYSLSIKIPAVDPGCCTSEFNINRRELEFVAKMSDNLKDQTISVLIPVQKSPLHASSSTPAATLASNHNHDHNHDHHNHNKDQSYDNMEWDEFQSFQGELPFSETNVDGTNDLKPQPQIQIEPTYSYHQTLSYVTVIIRITAIIPDTVEVSCIQNRLVVKFCADEGTLGQRKYSLSRKLSRDVNLDTWSVSSVNLVINLAKTHKLYWTCFTLPVPTSSALKF